MSLKVESEVSCLFKKERKDGRKEEWNGWMRVKEYFVPNAEGVWQQRNEKDGREDGKRRDEEWG